MSLAFQQRLFAAERFEKCCLAYFRHLDINYTVNGSEHTHRQLVERFRQDNSPRAKMIRFTPDTMVYMDGNLCYFEAKASTAIEKDAYLTYCRIQKTVMPVVIIMTDYQRVKWQFCDQIQFRPSDEVVKLYGKRAHPVDADGWITPRAGHGYAGSGSGTAYKEVDFSSMLLIPGFYDIVLKNNPELLPYGLCYQNGLFCPKGIIPPSSKNAA